MENKSAEKPLFPCEKCGRILKSKSGQTIPQKKCKWKNLEILESRGESEIEHPAKHLFIIYLFVIYLKLTNLQNHCTNNTIKNSQNKVG